MFSLEKYLLFDPISPLLDSKDQAIIYFVKRDLLGETVPSIQNIWKVPFIEKTLRNQQPDGSWIYKGVKRNPYPSHHYPLVATFKIYRDLIEKYELNTSHRSCELASEFILSHQTKKGDIRGMIGDQYATYYTGYILALLIKAGYMDDPRIIMGLEWLLSMRQDDGGWTIPMLTHYFDRKTTYRITSSPSKTVEPDRSQPFSHTWTNMILPCFALHPRYKNRPEIIHAADLMKSRFFKKDSYISYQSEYYWTRFVAWWPNLLTALHSLYRLGYTKDDPEISKALDWFITHQQMDGMWETENNPKKKRIASITNQKHRLWLTLSICRVLKNYFD
jgi:hypothetical protein